MGSCHGLIYRHSQDNGFLDSEIVDPHASHYSDLDDQLEIDPRFPETGYLPLDLSVAASPLEGAVDSCTSGETGMELGDADNKQEFTEYYQGCSISYQGGSMFLDSFWGNKYSDERKENLYFPFTSGEEWQFSAWCVCLGLSMGAIDSLLSLSIVSYYHLFVTFS